MSMVGTTYMERGKPVVVLAQWVGIAKLKAIFDGENFTDPTNIVGQVRKTGPRNVLIRREDGELVIRPFRGLRKVEV